MQLVRWLAHTHFQKWYVISKQLLAMKLKCKAKKRFGVNPDYIVACVGGGSNAVGAFTAFLNDPEVKLVGIEPAGHGLDTDQHSGNLNFG